MSAQKQKQAVVKGNTSAKKLPDNAPFVFGKMNYIITAVALAVMTIGFVLMTGKEGDIYDFRRTTLAPIVVILGFCIGFVAIFYKKKTQENTDQ